ncbi:MAG: fibrobacter succinogenes major paralogous domain-containing protein [Chitinophagales bacterium]|nr:fibrobacter succinogenes major paralogous domain-containing protein [Chitinophagales bacterium]
MNEHIPLGYEEWSHKSRGWKCPQLSKPGVKFVEIKFEGPGKCTYLPKRLLIRNVPIIRWDGESQPPALITVIISDTLTTYERITIRLTKWSMVIALIGVLISALALDIPEWIKRRKIADNNMSAIQPIGRGNHFEESETKWIKWGDNNLKVTIKNLSFEKYNDDSVIVYAENKETWDSCNKRGIGCWCYYDNDPHNGITYGKIYNWYAALDDKHGGVVPQGWHIINIDDIGKLPRPARDLKSVLSWRNRKDGTTGNGTDYYSFNALSGGFVKPDFTFTGKDSIGAWWTSNPASDYSYPDYKLEYFWHMQYDRDDSVYWDEVQRQYGFYIRCAKDNNAE